MLRHFYIFIVIKVYLSTNIESYYSMLCKEEYSEKLVEEPVFFSRITIISCTKRAYQ